MITTSPGSAILISAVLEGCAFGRQGCLGFWAWGINEGYVWLGFSKRWELASARLMNRMRVSESQDNCVLQSRSAMRDSRVSLIMPMNYPTNEDSVVSSHMPSKLPSVSVV